MQSILLPALALAGLSCASAVEGLECERVSHASGYGFVARSERKERPSDIVTFVQSTGGAVAFAGVLVILRPGVAIVSPWALAVLLAAVMFAGYQLLTRLVSAHDPLETTLLLTAAGYVLFATRREKG